MLLALDVSDYYCFPPYRLSPMSLTVIFKKPREENLIMTFNTLEQFFSIVQQLKFLLRHAVQHFTLLWLSHSML